ncbi:MAG: HAMP domain-containing sensor histidine kinase [Sphingomicrobium sp.]
MTKWRSSAAYRLAIGYSAALGVGMVVLGAIVFLAMHVAFTHQLDATIADESQTLATEYRSDGGGELSDAIAQRESSRSPARLMYAVFAPDGRRTYGTLRTARPALGVHDITFVDPRDGPDTARGLAIDLSPTERLLVAADREWIERIDRTILTVFAAGFVGLCLLAFGGAIVFGNYLRRRLQSISDGAEAIIAGDIRGRMTVGPRGDEFDQLATTLNRMLARIEQLLENLRQVSTDIAHDLRTPLAALRNQLEQGVSELGVAENDHRIIREAIVRVDDVLALFSAILRIAEVESGETRRFFDDVDISALALELAQSYAPAIRDNGRNLLWSIEPGLTLTGDRELIAQAASNIIENAQRHTPQGTLIRLTLVAVDDHICLQVNDDGPGVAKADRSRIVERFQRLDGSRHTPGHGLGLNLVSAVAKIHGGSLIFKDNGPGLVAILELPRVPADA